MSFRPRRRAYSFCGGKLTGSAFQHVVLDASEAQQANARIMQNYHIPSDHALVAP